MAMQLVTRLKLFLARLLGHGTISKKPLFTKKDIWSKECWVEVTARIAGRVLGGELRIMHKSDFLRVALEYFGISTDDLDTFGLRAVCDIAVIMYGVLEHSITHYSYQQGIVKFLEKTND